MKDKKPKNIDPTRYTSEAIKDAEKRGGYMLCSPSFMSDEDWRKASELVRKKGPLSDTEMIAYSMEHDRFARLHFLDLFFECERLYCIVNWLAALREEGK